MNRLGITLAIIAVVAGLTILAIGALTYSRTTSFDPETCVTTQTRSFLVFDRVETFQTADCSEEG